jgi:hypothetical protein
MGIRPLLAILWGLWLAPPVQADPECAALRGDEGLLPGEYLGRAWQALEPPDRGDVPDALARLDEGGIPRALPVDLGGDWRPELFLTTSDGHLCGTAGCPYELLAPDSYRRIGELFGHLAILDARVNGYRIVQSYSRYRAMTASLDTFVYDGGAYRLVSHAILDSCGLEQWRTRLRGVE